MHCVALILARLFAGWTDALTQPWETPPATNARLIDANTSQAPSSGQRRWWRPFRFPFQLSNCSNCRRRLHVDRQLNTIAFVLLPFARRRCGHVRPANSRPNFNIWSRIKTRCWNHCFRRSSGPLLCFRYVIETRSLTMWRYSGILTVSRRTYKPHALPREPLRPAACLLAGSLFSMLSHRHLMIS